MPEISVIVPVYNVESYLKECVDSILNQTYSDFELILVDDGSQDNCPSICDEYAKNDNRVIVIHKNNEGLSSARNAGLDYICKYSSSKYISFVDSDDYVHYRFLELLINNIGSSDICICEHVKVYKNDKPDFDCIDYNRIIIDNDSIWDYHFKNGDDFVICCNKLFKRHIFSKYRFPYGKTNEDEFALHRILGLSKNITIIGEKLYYYRQRVDSIMNDVSLRSQNRRRLNAIEIWVDRTKFFTFENSNLKRAIKSYNKALDKLIKGFKDFKRDKVYKQCFRDMRKIYIFCVKEKILKRSITATLFFFSPFIYFFACKIKDRKTFADN